MYWFSVTFRVVAVGMRLFVKSSGLAEGYGETSSCMNSWAFHGHVFGGVISYCTIVEIASSCVVWI
jgi:hypothetical protein